MDGDYRAPETYTQLKKLLGGARHPLHYLAIPPSMFGPVAEGLAQSGCATDARVVVEKPFGRDLDSAKELDRILHRFFPEPSIFRIDHFLGKEPVQNILYTRFANLFFEPIWNRTYIRSVQITLAENFGVEGRGKFYEEAAQFGTSFKITCFRCWPVLRWMRPRVKNAMRSGMRRRAFSKR